MAAEVLFPKYFGYFYGGRCKKHQQQTGSRSAYKFSRTESRNGEMQNKLLWFQLTQPSTLLATSSKLREIWKSESNQGQNSKWRLETSLWGCGVQHSHFQRSACVAGRQQLPTHHFVSGSTTAIVEHNLNSKIWNNGYGNRNCNVQWRKVVFLGTRRSSLEAANGPRQRCGSFSATCEMEDFLIKLKYHAPFDPISVFQYKLCLNKFPKGQQKDIQCCCFVE